MRGEGPKSKQVFGDKYYPTPAEQRIVEVQIKYPGQTVAWKCRQIEVSPVWWYKSWAKPEFVNYYKSLGRKELASQFVPLVQAALRFGLENPSNHQDRKMLLEMLGESRLQQEITHKYENLDDETLKKIIAGELDSTHGDTDTTDEGTADSDAGSEAGVGASQERKGD